MSVKITKISNGFILAVMTPSGRFYYEKYYYLNEREVMERAKKLEGSDKEAQK